MKQIQHRLTRQRSIIYANNRKGLLAEVSKIFLELDIDIITINVSNNKKGRATLSMSFDITGVEQLNRIIAKIRNVEGVIDIRKEQQDSENMSETTLRLDRPLKMVTICLGQMQTNCYIVENTKQIRHSSLIREIRENVL